MNKKAVIPLAALALVISAGGGLVATAHADTSSSTTGSSGQSHERPVAFGKVTAVSGTTVTMTGGKDDTTYTVDASSATVTKIEKPAAKGDKPTESTVSVSDVAVGDMISVEGTLNGTDVTATTITDGAGMGMRRGMGMGRGVMGTVTAVNGDTVTVKDKDGKEYTVDASSAKVGKMETISVSDIAVGDTVRADGDVNGTDVTAKNIMDGVPSAQGGDK